MISPVHIRRTSVCSAMLVAGSLVAGLLVTTPAQAAHLHGVWQSVKSGSLFHVSPPVPASVDSLAGKPSLAGALVAVRTAKGGGTPTVMLLRWVDGMRGAQFRLGRAVGTLAPDGNHVRFGSGVQWARVSHGSPAAAPAGFWSSSSGSVFMVTAPGSRDFFVAGLKNFSGRAYVSAARWIPGMQGRQLSYGGSNTATLAPGGRQMRVVGTKVNTWTLIAPWGAPRAHVVRAPQVSIGGNWRSRDSGVVLGIPGDAGRDFDVVWQSANGRSMRKLRANWTRGLRGTQLQFSRRQERITCTWSERNPHSLQVMGWNGRTETFTRTR